MTQEEIKTIQDELDKLFVALQKIDAPMTENNVVIMNACLGSVKFIFNLVKEAEEKGGSADGDADAK